MINWDKAIPHLQTGIQPVGEDTVYMSAVDGEGNACSFINSLFMAGYRAGGAWDGGFLQNRAALFSLDPEHPNALAVANVLITPLFPG